MKTYTVRSGQNIFDVAITLYGSIEGVFDLLISNEDWAGRAPLSFDTDLKPGDVLSYNPEFLINGDITDWFDEKGQKVANGVHTYSHIDVRSSILQFVEEQNKKMLEVVSALYPDVWDFDNDTMLKQYDKSHVSDFMQYVYDNYWGSGYSNIEHTAKLAILGDDVEHTSANEDELFKESLVKTRMLILQTGQRSVFECGISSHTVLGIDWGDTSEFEIYTNKPSGSVFEHYYDDDGQHRITLYGNFVLEDLDFSKLNGIYYPTSQINVKGSFTSNFSKDNVLNELIAIEQ